MGAARRGAGTARWTDAGQATRGEGGGTRREEFEKANASATTDATGARAHLDVGEAVPPEVQVPDLVHGLDLRLREHERVPELHRERRGGWGERRARRE